MAAVRLLPPKLQASLGLTSKGSSSHRSGVEAKRQLFVKSDLPKTCVANSSVDLDPQPNKTLKSSASTSSLAFSPTLSSTKVPAEDVPIPDPAYPDLITCTVLRALTPPPSLVIPNPAPFRQAHTAPAPYPPPALRPNSVMFGSRIAEALLYTMTAQAPYPPPVAPLTDDLAAKTTAREILSAPSLL